MLLQGRRFRRGEIHREEGNEEMVVRKGGWGVFYLKRMGDVKVLGR